MATNGTADAFFANPPLAMVGDMANAYTDYVCDAADALENALKRCDLFQHHTAAVDRTVRAWQDAMVDAGNAEFDAFENHALAQIFNVPAHVAAHADAPHGPADAADKESAENAALWAQLQERVALKRELQRRLATARRVERAWEAQRDNVGHIFNSYQPKVVADMLSKARQLQETLEALPKAEPVPVAATTAAATGGDTRLVLAAKDPLQRRDAIQTVSVNDLDQLSAVLCS